MILSRRFVVRTGLVCALAAKAGDPLAIIDPRTLQAQLAEQRAARAKDEALLQGALLDLKRYEDLSRRDFASRQPVDQQRAQVDQYRAQIDSDQAQIDYAQTQLGYTTIRSPIEGRAGIRQIDQGNSVHAAVIFDRATLIRAVIISSNEIAGLQAGLEIDWVRAAAMGVTPLAVDNTLYDAFGQRQIRTIYLPHNYSPVILEAGPTMQADPASLNTAFVPGTGRRTGALGGPDAAGTQPRDHVDGAQRPVPRRDDFVRHSAGRVDRRFDRRDPAVWSAHCTCRTTFAPNSVARRARRPRPAHNNSCCS
jgi:hypothetical protein